MQFSASGIQPLDGLKVIDVSSFLAGPFCSTQLAEFGADARVESLGDTQFLVTRFVGHGTLL